MRSVNVYFMLVLATLLASCEMKCSVGNTASTENSKPVTSTDNPAIYGAVIKNDIELEVTGVKLKQAYLVDEKYNLLNENKTRVGEKIYLVIKVDTGWTKENDKSFIGASERISTSDGNVIVDAADIFKDYETTGMDANDSKVISMSAVLTEVRSGIESFVVQFRVWDKKGPGEIKGKYKFKIVK